MSGALTLENLAWNRFDPTRVDPEILRMVKAAGLKPQGRLSRGAMKRR